MVFSKFRARLIGKHSLEMIRVDPLRIRSSLGIALLMLTFSIFYMVIR